MLTAEVRGLFESLLARAQQIDALALALPDQIRANRERREGRPIHLGRSTRMTLRSFERDSHEAAAEIPALTAGLQSEALLVQTALASERMALEMGRAVFTGGHPEDESIARPLLVLRRENIAELEAFSHETRR